MNKFYLTALTVTIVAGGAMAQTKSQMPLSQRVKATIDQTPHNFQSARGGVSAIWSDDFSDANNWVLSYEVGAPALNWQIGIGLENTGTYPTAPIQSTTAANGYAMLDSDGFANQSLVEKSYMTTANPIDLSAVDRVVLQFESFYRKWTSEECYIVISTNNTDWPDLTPDSDISALPNVFYAWPDMEVQAVINNPTLVRINISDVAGNAPQVWVRFVWTGTYGYSWFVDDVAIIEQPANDVVLNNSFISHTGNGEEYGCIPSSQLNSSMLMGGEFYNFGYDAQTNIELAMEVFNDQNEVVFSFTDSEPSVATELSVILEGNVNIPALPNGLYRASATVTSSEEQSGLFFGNNTHLRNFTVNDEIYALDGIGQHPDGYQALGSIGTNSFEDGADGLMIFAYYEVSNEMDVHGIEFQLQSTTRAGGAVIVSIHDTTDVRNNVVTNALYQGDIYDITEADTIAGFVRIMFDQPMSLSAGGYYAGVELFSGSNENDIRILNDLTVPQPALASVIYIPADQVYTNGNASAIRLVLDPSLSVGDAGSLRGVSMYPNPSNGIINVTTGSAELHLVEIFNVMGSNVLTTSVNGNGSIDLSGNAPGIYSVRISNGEAFMVQRIVLN
ncbi:MAG: T9SS type A sorting domain-containing protein [Flavobacteriales bacterium]|nr:T9SS type A sorting domain-containing protein [Flavobacteriales bacterium]